TTAGPAANTLPEGGGGPGPRGRGMGRVVAGVAAGAAPAAAAAAGLVVVGLDDRARREAARAIAAAGRSRRDAQPEEQQRGQPADAKQAQNHGFLLRHAWRGWNTAALYAIRMRDLRLFLP